MGKESTCRREACWYHPFTAKRTGISSCTAAPAAKAALLLCLWKTMTWSWLVPTATIPAESQSLPSKVHSWLRGLALDKEQLGVGHLDPQALTRSVPFMTFKTLVKPTFKNLVNLLSYLCINLQCPWDVNGRQLSWVTPWEGQQLPQGETALEREYERRGSSVLTKLQRAWKIYWHPWGLLKPVFFIYEHIWKRKGQHFVTTLCSNLILKMLCGPHSCKNAVMEHIHSTVSAPRCSQTRTPGLWDMFLLCSHGRAEQSQCCHKKKGRKEILSSCQQQHLQSCATL